MCDHSNEHYRRSFHVVSCISFFFFFSTILKKKRHFGLPLYFGTLEIVKVLGAISDSETMTLTVTSWIGLKTTDVCLNVQQLLFKQKDRENN